MLFIRCDHGQENSRNSLRRAGSKRKVLHDRLEKLKAKGTLSPVLIESLDELRYLGNDAAHLEAKVYDEIGSEEVALGIDFTKEILESLYQHEGLLNRMKSLKKPAKKKTAKKAAKKTPTRDITAEKMKGKLP